MLPGTRTVNGVVAVIRMISHSVVVVIVVVVCCCCCQLTILNAGRRYLHADNLAGKVSVSITRSFTLQCQQKSRLVEVTAVADSWKMAIDVTSRPGPMTH